MVEFESNYTEIPAAGPEQSYYARESWTLSRARGVMSRTPDRARVFTCPSCGAPLESMVGGRCQYCQATVDTGQLDWVVEAITIASREARGPMLTGTTEEKGTDMPTVVDRDVTPRFAELSQRDPQFVWPQFQARVAMIFGAMQVSWSSREWAQVRPFVSDNLFQMLAYWIEAYKRAHLRNVTEGARVEQIELARVTSDKFFDALTVRLFATSLDYTIADADGRVVGGNKSRRGATASTGRSSAAPARPVPREPTERAPRAALRCASRWPETANTAERKSPPASSTGSFRASSKTTSTKARGRAVVSARYGVRRQGRCDAASNSLRRDHRRCTTDHRMPARASRPAEVTTRAGVTATATISTSSATASPTELAEPGARIGRASARGSPKNLQAARKAVFDEQTLAKRARPRQTFQIAGQVPARDTRTPKCSPRAATLASRCARQKAMRSSAVGGAISVPLSRSARISRKTHG